jgi:GDP-L-fucose synthase
MTILVTGGSGFVGRALRRVLPYAIFIGSKDADLTNEKEVDDIFLRYRPKVVVHLAAQVGGIMKNLARPADLLLTNSRIDANVLDTTRRHYAAHFIPIFSTCMYPDCMPESRYPMSEDDVMDGAPPKSNAAYAQGKRLLLAGTFALNQQYQIPFTGLIPTNLYGPGDHFNSKESHFLAAAIHKIASAKANNHTVTEFMGTGTALRQYLFVDDLAALIKIIVQSRPSNKIYNVGPRENLPIKELAQKVASLLEYEGRLNFSGKGPDGQKRKDVSVDRLLVDFPCWKNIETPLKIGFIETIRWYRRSVEPS